MNCPYCNHPVANHPDEKRTYCADCWEAGLHDENDLHCTHKRYNLERAAWKEEAMAGRALIGKLMVVAVACNLHADEWPVYRTYDAIHVKDTQC